MEKTSDIGCRLKIPQNKFMQESRDLNYIFSFSLFWPYIHAIEIKIT